MPEPAAPTSSRNAALVAAGILASRVMGLVRQRLFAHVLGSGVEAAAFTAATRIPNVLQNLLGEGVLSASFIPVYAGLRAQGREADAGRLAGAVFSLLSLVVALVVAAGLLWAPELVTALAPGFDGEARALTISLVRIVFPGTGALVLSAWCLGVLNSHRRFFLSYAAPVAWNLCMVGVLAWWALAPVGAGLSLETVVTTVAWASVAGSVLQFVVQLPPVLKLLDSAVWRPAFDEHLRRVLASFGPTVVGRGVVQLSSYVDLAYASLLGQRAVAAMGYAQTIALLPVSVFGMAISAAELPELAADATGDVTARNEAIGRRLESALDRMAFFVAPSAVALVALGDCMAAVLLQSGRFGPSDSRYTWFLLICSGLALTAQTRGRLLSSALYALRDAQQPLRFAVARVVAAGALGYLAVSQVPVWLQLPSEAGAVALMLASAVGAWLEYALLSRAVRRHLGQRTLATRSARVWGAALAAMAMALAAKVALGSWAGTSADAALSWGGALLLPPALPTLVTSLGLLAGFGLAYLAASAVLGVPQARAVLKRVRVLR